MKNIIIILAMLLTACASQQALTPEQKIAGKWRYTEKSPHQRHDKVCEFFSSGDLACLVEVQTTAMRYGKGQRYRTVGNWHINNSVLSISEAPVYKTKQSKQQQYNIEVFETNKLLLSTENKQYNLWHKEG